MCESFNIQYNTNFISVMPTNLYGPGDNYDLEKSHVLPALLRKIYLGKCLEDGNWPAIRKDLDKKPVEDIKGNSNENNILEILRKYGIEIDESNNKGEDKENNTSQGNIRKVAVKVWGTGSPLREFMYSLDMAAACVFIMENVDIGNIIKLNQPDADQKGYHTPHFLNIGTGEEISIKDLALRIKRLTGFRGEIIFDPSKPDGTMRKTIDIGLLKKLGYKHQFNLNAGLAETYSSYIK